jgi:hypothetical protein
MLSSLGEPTNSKMIWAWLRSVLPSRMGLPSNISAKTQLVIVRMAHGEKEKSNVPSAPHVYGWSVSSQLQEKLWRTIPPCHDEGRVIAYCIAVASAGLRNGAVVVSSETEIGNLEQTTVVDENVCSCWASDMDRGESWMAGCRLPFMSRCKMWLSCR